jgi:hypothetical protein
MSYQRARDQAYHRILTGPDSPAKAWLRDYLARPQDAAQGPNASQLIPKAAPKADRRPQPISAKDLWDQTDDEIQ